ncbi:VOC family protein [Myxococcota bacterium]|nr:VOC family protein [Myxococcota bacterium]
MHADSIAWNGLGYVGVVAPDPVAWGRFATEVCGFVPSEILPGPRPQGRAVPVPEASGIAADGTCFLKLDRRQWRLAVHPGAKAGLAYLGWEMRSAADFERIVARIGDEKVAVRAGTEAERMARGVARLAVLEDPFGHRLEIFQGAIIDAPFASPTGIEFKTGDLGMGHAVLFVADIERALAFYREVLGFQRSDYMVFGPNEMGIHFLRCTPRHHSLALLQVGAPAGLQHLMFESTTLDGVGRALDRARARRVPISSDLGRHRNDGIVSFYMNGPSGFDIEIGWDGVLCGDDWSEREFAGGDDWGHHGLVAASMQPKG